MSEKLVAFEWLKRNLEKVQPLVVAGKNDGKNGPALDRILFESLVPLMIDDGVIPESLPTSISEFRDARRQALIEFPRGRGTRPFNADLAKAGDAETRDFLDHVPNEAKRIAYHKAERELEALIGAIREVMDRFPHLEQNIGRDDLATALDCALSGAPRNGLIASFALRILRKASIDMCEQVARTKLID